MILIFMQSIAPIGSRDNKFNNAVQANLFDTEFETVLCAALKKS